MENEKNYNDRREYFWVNNLDLSSFEKIKDSLFIKLINPETDPELLSKTPSKSFADLYTICQVELSHPFPGMRAVIPVTHSLLKLWAIDFDTVYYYALENTVKKHPPVLTPLENVIVNELSALAGDDPELEKELLLNPTNVYVLTNEEKLNGGAVIIYPGIPEMLCGIFPEGYYILPSSVHELLIAPKEAGCNVQDLINLVRDVNRSIVSEQDFLSDNVYEYDPGTRQIIIAGNDNSETYSD